MLDITTIVGYPPVLYKYRVWEDSYHKKILLDNSIFLASPNSFEDIKDCNIVEYFPSSHTDLYNTFLNKSRNINPDYSEEQHSKFAAKWSVESPLANIDYRDDLLMKLKSEFDNRFGVLSLTANPCSDEMWRKYGNDHKGICIGFDTRKLLSVAGGGGPVCYYRVLPVIDFFNDDFRTKHIKNIMSKEDKWAFEEEYRLHKMWKHNVHLSDRNISLPKDCIVKVILGSHMSDISRNEVVSVVQSKHNNIIVEDERI